MYHRHVMRGHVSRHDARVGSVGRVRQQVQQLGAPPALVADGGALTSAGCGVGLSGGGEHMDSRAVSSRSCSHLKLLPCDAGKERMAYVLYSSSSILLRAVQW